MVYFQSTIALVIFTLLAWALGRRVQGAGHWVLGTGCWVENFFFSFAMGFGIIGYAVYLLGIAGQLNAMGLAILLIAVLFISRPQIKECVMDIFGAIRKLGLYLNLSFYLKIALFLALAAGVIVFIGSMAPSYSNDSMVYHLVDAKYFAATGTVGPIPYNSVNALWPYLVEMYFTAAIVAKLLPLAGLFHFLLGAVSAVGVFALAKRFFTVKTAVLAACVFALTPGIFMEARETYVDLGAVLYCLAAVYAFLIWRENREMKWAALAGAMCGLGMSVKYFAVVVPVILGCWMLVEAVRGVQRTGQSAGGQGCGNGNEARIGHGNGDVTVTDKRNGHRNRNLTTNYIKALLFFCVFTVLFSCAWYIRQWLVMGNPFFPFFQQIFGFSGLDRNIMWLLSNDVIQSSMKVSYGLKNIFAMPWHVTMHPDNYGGEQLGFLFLAIVPGIALIRPISRVTKELLIFVLGYMILWFFGYQNLRFLLPAAPFLAVLAAYAAGELEKEKVLGRIVRLAVMSYLLFSAALVIYYNAEAVETVFGMKTKAAYLAKNERSYEVSEYVNINLPKDSNLLVVNEINTFYIDKPYKRELHYWIYTGYDRELDSAEDVIGLFKKEGFTHILFATAWSAEHEDLVSRPMRLTYLIKDPAFREKYLKLLYTTRPRSRNAQGVTYEVYRIK